MSTELQNVILFLLTRRSGLFIIKLEYFQIRDTCRIKIDVAGPEVFEKKTTTNILNLLGSTLCSKTQSYRGINS